MAWIKRALINTVLILVSIGMTVLIVEVALHFTPLKLKYLYPLEPGGYLHADPELGFDITPNFATSTHAFTDLSYPVWSNSMGCYDYEYDGSSPYIYITGDSFTWGFTPLADKWGKGVEKNLGIRTLTCGVNAYGTRQELIKTRRDLARLPQPPKLIVVGYFEGNDLGDDFAFPTFTAYNGYRVSTNTHCDPTILIGISPLVSTTTCNVPELHYTLLQKIKFELSLHSVLYMIAQTNGVWDKLKGLLAVKGTSWPSTKNNEDPAWHIHAQSFAGFKQLADSYNTKVLFVLIPEREEVRASSTPSSSSIHELTKTFLTAEGIEYVDLLPEFRAQEKLPDTAFYWPINEHWNVAGNHLAGELVSRYILEHHLLSTSTNPL